MKDLVKDVSRPREARDQISLDGRKLTDLNSLRVSGDAVIVDKRGEGSQSLGLLTLPVHQPQMPGISTGAPGEPVPEYVLIAPPGCTVSWSRDHSGTTAASVIDGVGQTIATYAGAGETVVTNNGVTKSQPTLTIHSKPVDPEFMNFIEQVLSVGRQPPRTLGWQGLKDFVRQLLGS